MNKYVIFKRVIATQMNVLSPIHSKQKEQRSATAKPKQNENKQKNTA